MAEYIAIGRLFQRSVAGRLSRFSPARYSLSRKHLQAFGIFTQRLSAMHCHTPPQDLLWDSSRRPALWQASLAVLIIGNAGHEDFSYFILGRRCSTDCSGWGRAWQ